MCQSQHCFYGLHSIACGWSCLSFSFCPVCLLSLIPSLHLDLSLSLCLPRFSFSHFLHWPLLFYLSSPLPFSASAHSQNTHQNKHWSVIVSNYDASWNSEKRGKRVRDKGERRGGKRDTDRDVREAKKHESDGQKKSCDRQDGGLGGGSYCLHLLVHEIRLW